MRLLACYKWEIFIFFFIILFFFASRLYNLNSLPIFTDEAIYIRWAQIAKQDAAWRFISLTDGKQPSFVWLTMIMIRFIEDPLLAGRLVSVAAGFFAMIGLFFLGKELFKNRWIGLASSFLYIVFPMALVYDRMALYDSLVGMFMIWSSYVGILLVKTTRLDIALLLGMIMGGGALTKTSAFFSMPLLFSSALLLDWRNKIWKSYLLRWITLALLSIILAFGYYSVLRLSPFFHTISEKNSIFAYPLSEWIQHPTLYVFSNLRGLFDWLLTYYTLPLFLLVIGAFLISKKDDAKSFWILGKTFGVFLIILGIVDSLKYLTNVRVEPLLYFPFLFFTLLMISMYVSFIRKYDFWREKTFLIVWFLAPFVYLAFFGRTIYPRFILFMAIFLLPLAAFSLITLYQRINNKALGAAMLVFLLFLPLRSDFFILTNFARSPIPRLDLDQYSNQWPAGGGVRQIIAFLQEQALKEKIYVASEGTFGSLPTYAVEIYLGDRTNVEKRGIWPVPQDIPEDLLKRAKTMPVYFIFNQTQTPPPGWPIRLIVRYQKGVEGSYISLYQVEKR